MILNHVSVGVSNVASAVAFYDSVLSALSVKRSHYIENVAAAYGGRLSGIHAAWHFWYAVSFDGEVGLRKLGLGGIHPLTRRYV